MKVLYLTGMYPTPAYPQKGIFCHEQVKALKTCGADVDVVVPVTFYDAERPPRTWEYEGVRVRYVRFFKLPGTRLFERIGTYLYRALLLSNMDFRQYDVIHADSPLPCGYAAMLLSRKFGIPFVVHGHGLDVFLEESYAGAKNGEKVGGICALVYEKANAVAGVSQKVLDRICRKVDLTGRAYVVYNGVDTERFCPGEKEITDIITLTSVGNLIPLKGHDYTIRAVKQLVDGGYTNIRLQIAGRGREEASLKALTAELGMEEYVRFLGYIPYEAVKNLLQKSDVFVLPSYYEALGCVYLEAMACGVPAIGCWENGIDEIIVHGKTGYLVDNRGLNQLAECLKSLLDQQTRQRVGKAAREAVVQKYQWRHSAQCLMQVYGRCIKRGNDHGV